MHIPKLVMEDYFRIGYLRGNLKNLNHIIAMEMVQACAYHLVVFAKSLEETLELAKKSAEITHNHPEGIKGAQAIASAIFLSREGWKKIK